MESSVGEQLRWISKPQIFCAISSLYVFGLLLYSFDVIFPVLYLHGLPISVSIILSPSLYLYFFYREEKVYWCWFERCDFVCFCYESVYFDSGRHAIMLAYPFILRIH